MAHHCIAVVTTQKVHSRGTQEFAMIQRAHKRPKTVEVHVMFEPSRLEQRVLHQAYSYLLPVTRRCIQTQGRRSEEGAPEALSQTRERSAP